MGGQPKRKGNAEEYSTCPILVCTKQQEQQEHEPLNTCASFSFSFFLSLAAVASSRQRWLPANRIDLVKMIGSSSKVQLTLDVLQGIAHVVMAGSFAVNGKGLIGALNFWN